MPLWLALPLMPVAAYLAIVGAIYSLRLADDPWRIAAVIVCFIGCLLAGLFTIVALGEAVF